MENAIYVNNLRKVFQVRESAPGLLGAAQGFLKPKYKNVNAIENISFRVRPGERIAFLGPNGAGKSTTIKILSGILFPTSGDISVLGLIPWRHRQILGYRIGTVFGQRSQLWYHLPARATFGLLAKVYDMDDDAFHARRELLVERFGAGALIDRPVRQLSLGERMRCEIIASLLHRPQILFLDEPTIGLDVNAKAIIRDFILQQAAEDNSTIFLTSHDTGDIEKVCERVIVINEGKLLLDQSLPNLRAKFIHRKLITLSSEESQPVFQIPGAVVKAQEPHKTILEVNTQTTSIESVVHAAFSAVHVRDISVEDPPMEEIVKEIYSLRSQDFENA